MLKRLMLSIIDIMIQNNRLRSPSSQVEMWGKKNSGAPGPLRITCEGPQPSSDWGHSLAFPQFLYWRGQNLIWRVFWCHVGCFHLDCMFVGEISGRTDTDDGKGYMEGVGGPHPLQRQERGWIDPAIVQVWSSTQTWHGCGHLEKHSSPIRLAETLINSFTSIQQPPKLSKGRILYGSRSTSIFLFQEELSRERKARRICTANQSPVGTPFRHAYMEEKAFVPGCQGPSSPGLPLRVSPEFLHFLNVPLMTLQRATSGMPPSAWRPDTHQQFPEIPDCTSASVCIFPPLNVNLPRTKTIPYS